MKECISARDDALADLSKNKRSIAVTATEIRRIDRLLAEKWKIDLVRTDLHLEEYLSRLPESEARIRGLAVYAKARESNDSMLGERLIYEAMENLDLCGLVTSTRRQFLIDAVSLSCGLYRALGLSGPVLDIGCHVGVVPDVMALTLGVKAVGIEPVTAAVDAGNSVLMDRDDVQLIHASMPWDTDLRFDLITAIDSMPTGAGARALFLKSVGSLLRSGGIAVIISPDWIDADVSTLRRQLDLAGLGFGFADVVGGFGGMPNQFTAEGAACLLKNGKRPFPRKFKAEAESEWDWFREYANASDTPLREKTQSFFRAGKGF